jgi:hypothetical protein
MAAMLLLLANEPLVVMCSSRPNTCGTVTQMVRDDAARCGLNILLRDYTSGPFVFTADAAMYEVVVKSGATDKQQECLNDAVRTVHARLYALPSGSRR